MLLILRKITNENLRALEFFIFKLFFVKYFHMIEMNTHFQVVLKEVTHSIAFNFTDISNLEDGENIGNKLMYL